MQETLTMSRWQARRSVLKGLVIDLMGGFRSTRGSLKPRLIKRNEQDKRVTEEVSFESEPGVRITALVSKARDDRLPAVICLHGTLGDKETMEDAHFDELTRRGFLAIAIDQRYYTWRTHNRDLGLAQEAVVRGYCMYRDLTWDVSRTIDYLCSRVDVDASRIGCTGISLGGALTWLSAALDDRISVIAPACGVSTWDRIFKEGADVWHSIGAFIPGILKYTDVGEVISLVAPRPMLILAGSKDVTLPIKGTLEAYDYARSVYGLFKADDKIKLFVDERGHAYSSGMKREAYTWFEKWMNPP